MKPTFYLCLMSAALCGAANHDALAQTGAAPKTLLPAPGAETKRAHQIRIQNVPPSLIAFWLDPKSNPLPRQFGARINPYGAAPNATPDNTPNPAFALPTGIDRIVPIDPQKALLVFGTDAAFQKLAEVVAFLDQPLRQVEIEAQWVQIPPEDARAFGINYAGPTNPNAPQIGFVRGNFGATLAQLVEQKRAKVLTAPRLLAINNLTASLGSFASSSAAMNVKGQDDASGLASLFAGNNQVGLEYSLTVTPTINNDDSVTVLMSTSSNLKITTESGEEFLSNRNKPALESIVNVRDGDTFVLSGGSSGTTAGLKDAKNPLSNLMIFVTARIVRRAGNAVEPVALPR